MASAGGMVVRTDETFRGHSRPSSGVLHEGERMRQICKAAGMAVAILSLGSLWGAAPEPVAEREPFYSNHYDSAENLAHWSKRTPDKTAGDAMLGPFGAESE